MRRSILAATGCLFLSAMWMAITLPHAHNSSVETLDTPFVPGHDVLVTRNPEESTFWKIELLKNANKSIEFSVGFTGGPLLEKALLLLETCLTQKPDLKVHLFVSDCPLFGWADKRKLELLAQRHPDRFHYLIRGMSGLRNGYNLVTSENHIKMLVVDEKYVVLGGTNLFHYQSRSKVPEDIRYENLVNYFHPKACIDMDLVVRGPCAANLRQDFYRLWALYESGESTTVAQPFEPESTRYFDLPEESACCAAVFDESSRVVRNVPLKSMISGPRCYPGACSAEYASLINSAERSIDLMHMYISPVDEVYDSLVSATARGVGITLITNGGGDPVPMVTKAIGTYNQAYLLPVVLGRRFGMGERDQADACNSTNCAVYTYEAEHTLYHKKVMVIDDHLTVVGSYNLGHKSHYGDYEVIVEVESPEVAKEIKHVMDEDRERSKLCNRAQMTDWHFGFGPRSLALIEGALIVGPLY
ncbi:MAG: phosphatidylserine/phosphatidylglycerophosphate/cardiolipin synthase family protein [Chlamydiales bacterium]|nr:phosphatidylserine/phosphatidylglycerophosphate/cardiolipin synthase family protein [Chlamydiales bacterium]